MTFTATKETLRVWTNENHTDMLEILAAELIHKTVAADVDTYTAEYFAALAGTFTSDELEDIDAAMWVDGNDEAVDAYYAGQDALHAANGYDIPAGHCPALRAADDLMDARKKVVKSLCKALDMNFGVISLNNFDRMLEILMKTVNK